MTSCKNKQKKIRDCMILYDGLTDLMVDHHIGSIVSNFKRIIVSPRNKSVSFVDFMDALTYFIDKLDMQLCGKSGLFESRIPKTTYDLEYI